jgi:hypothetical protein
MAYEGISGENSCDRVAAAVTYARWFEVDADFEAAIRHVGWPFLRTKEVVSMRRGWTAIRPRWR